MVKLLVRERPPLLGPVATRSTPSELLRPARLARPVHPRLVLVGLRALLVVLVALDVPALPPRAERRIDLRRRLALLARLARELAPLLLAHHLAPAHGFTSLIVGVTAARACRAGAPRRSRCRRICAVPPATLRSGRRSGGRARSPRRGTCSAPWCARAPRRRRRDTTGRTRPTRAARGTRSPVRLSVGARSSHRVRQGRPCRPRRPASRGRTPAD